MQIRIIKIFALLFVTIAFGCGHQSEWIETLPKPWLLNENEVNEILPEFQKRFPNFEERLKAIIIWRIGTPYAAFKLGEEFLPDTDPIIRLDVSDCTVHVLTSLAFAQSKTWEEARSKIIKIHYKVDENVNQMPTYESRWHFTSDRILSNLYTVNITNMFVDSSALENANLILNLREDGTELLDLDWTRKIQLSYIPNNRIDSELFCQFPQVCGIALVKKTYFKDGLAIAHEGILINNKDFIHASSIEKKTVKENFMDYYFNKGDPSFDGIMIYKFVPIGLAL